VRERREKEKTQRGVRRERESMFSEPRPKLLSTNRETKDQREVSGK